MRWRCGATGGCVRRAEPRRRCPLTRPGQPVSRPPSMGDGVLSGPVSPGSSLLGQPPSLLTTWSPCLPAARCYTPRYSAHEDLQELVGTAWEEGDGLGLSQLRQWLPVPVRVSRCADVVECPNLTEEQEEPDRDQLARIVRSLRGLLAQSARGVPEPSEP
jgi:hypothetical protein